MASDRLAAIKAFDETNAGVKGLVDAGVTAVPAFFRHPPDPLSQSACPDAAAIPVVDLSGSRSEVVGAVRAAAQAAGFFQLVNHGVPEAAMWRMLAAGRRFNEEPPEAKAPYYTRDAARRVRYNCNADLFRTLLGKWRDTIYMEDMDKEKDDEELLPPALRGAAPDTRRRFGRWGASSLGCSLRPWGCGAGTCLPGGGGRLPGGTQRDGVGGLQVLVDGDGGEPAAWSDAPAMPGALLVNVGDFLQLVSNDRANAARACAPAVADAVGPPCYKSVTAEELLRSSIAQTLGDLRL
ncbi:hypothetical protein CFC21_099558 [Triticum aestivum]|uniref:Non-haem dioxygenase N-terminal domain-containing protein n=2 Tax=Triticum aestivum TaxID=4565 RepID=A0A9R1N224_WHEAT|nr:hypothetical protein CFC21_099558 [Triticum aestivum]